MLNFFISIAVFAVSVFLLGASIRYGLIGAGRLDDYFSSKSGRSFNGYSIFYRIPFGIGFIPEYFFFLVIGRSNYFKTNWWPIKTSGLLSILIAIAILNSRSVVYQYFSLDLLQDQGIAALFTSGIFVWFLNIITLLYFALFVLIIIESVKMHGFYAPVRIIIYSLLSFMMAQLTVIVLGLIVAVTIIYIAFKIVVFLFFSSRRSRNRREEDDDESTGDILKGGLRSFKQEVLEWEGQLKSKKVSRKETVKPKVRIRRKKPKIKRTTYKDDIPRLHPD